MLTVDAYGGYLIQSRRVKRMNGHQLIRKFQSALVPQDQIQMTGDFSDPAYSVNDPIFPFLHAQIDRHFTHWVFSQDKSNFKDYFGFPRSGYAYGCNLDDVISSTDSFTSLFNPFELNTSHAAGRRKSSVRYPQGPYTVKVFY